MSCEPAHLMEPTRVLSPQTIACYHQFPRDFKCNIGNSIWPEYSLTSVCFQNVLYKHSGCRNSWCTTWYWCSHIFWESSALLPFISLTSRGLRASFDPCMTRPAESFPLWIRTNLKTSFLRPECAVTKHASDVGSRTSYIFDNVLFSFVQDLT